MSADQWGAVDVGDVVVVRAVRDAALADGFGDSEVDAAVDAALRDRSSKYDFAVLLNTDELPTQFPEAQAFHHPYNTDGVTGTGTSAYNDPDHPLLAALWMNSTSSWDKYDPDWLQWIAAQEIGHQWLVHATFEDGDVLHSRDLLGRQGIHWSYFVDTGNSPMEGNAWIDNGDGTFTTDLDREPSFSPLDLYLMGFVGAPDVPSFFYIDDPVAPRTPSSGPEHLDPVFGPITATGTRKDVGIDQVIASLGPRVPGPDASQRDFAALPVLVLGPSELLTQSLLDEVTARFGDFAASWLHYAGDYSTMSFTVVDEGHAIPPLDPAPALVPRAAW